MSALQWVDIPGYSAIIFRRTLTASMRAGGVMDRAHEWLGPTEARWQSRTNSYHFPSGATLAFGYIDTFDDFQQYQGPEYQFVGWDEVTQFPMGWGESAFKYMFSRLRRLKGSNVPIRCRSAANPGGWGHQWVKTRYDIRYDPQLRAFRGFNPTKPFIPSYAWENIHLDVDDYIDSLMELDPITREQLLRGDWAITEKGRFDRAWFHRYVTNDSYVALDLPNGNRKTVLKNQVRYFITIDPATTEAPGESFYANREPSWSVISAWALVEGRYLCLWRCRRFQKEIPAVIQEIKMFYDQMKAEGTLPEAVCIEHTVANSGVYQFCVQLGLPVYPLSTNTSGEGPAKLLRSAPAAIRAEAGQIFIPTFGDKQYGDWVNDWEDEIYRWTGHPHMTADQVDAFSYAVIYWNTNYEVLSGEGVGQAPSRMGQDYMGSLNGMPGSRYNIPTHY
jgi:hypothetical protein